MACDLFRRCLTQRQDEDWSELTRLYGSRFRSLVWQALLRHDVPRPDQEIDDYLQELFLRLLALDECSFRGRDEMQLWRYLARIADRMVADRRRGRKKAKLLETPRPPCSHPSREPSPECRAIVRDRLHGFLRSCRRAAGGVELRVRIMRLAFFDGLSSSEIARSFSGGLSPTQIDSLICRLRHRLAAQGVEVVRRRRATALAAS